MFSFLFLLIYKRVVNSIIQVSVVVELVLSVEVSTFLGELYYLGLLRLEVSKDFMGPLELLGGLFIEVAARRVEGSIDNRAFTDIFQNLFLAFDVEAFDPLEVQLLLAEKIVDFRFKLGMVSFVFSRVDVVLCKDEVTFRQNG